MSGRYTASTVSVIKIHWCLSKKSESWFFSKMKAILITFGTLRSARPVVYLDTCLLRVRVEDLLSHLRAVSTWSVRRYDAAEDPVRDCHLGDFQCSAHHFSQNDRPEACQIVRGKSTKEHSNTEESLALDNGRWDTAKYVHKLLLYSG